LSTAAAAAFHAAGKSKLPRQREQFITAVLIDLFGQCARQRGDRASGRRWRRGRGLFRFALIALAASGGEQSRENDSDKLPAAHYGMLRHSGSFAWFWIETELVDRTENEIASAHSRARSA
jgi:hypothetical protein